MSEPVPAQLTKRACRSGFAVLIISALAALAVIVLAPPASGLASGPPSHREQVRFMWAMAGQESGWDYHARNATSGAFGKYQIMPFNWPAWASQYLGDATADQTPWNQERVAYGKIRDLYGWLGSWKRVAYWWLTGRTERRERQWSSYSRGYVSNIMRLRHEAPRDAGALPARTSSRSAPGDWRRSAGTQRLRLSVAGRTWPRRGAVHDGQLLRVRSVSDSHGGRRWVRVVTRDGRLGWLPQLDTLPAVRPAAAQRWGDVSQRGGLLLPDRQLVRPRPR